MNDINVHSNVHFLHGSYLYLYNSTKAYHFPEYIKYWSMMKGYNINNICTPKNESDFVNN